MHTKGTNLFAQMVALFDRHAFGKLVHKYGNDKHSKGFSSWEHFVSMLFCQLGKAQSLREICGGLASCTGKVVHLRMKEAPKRSTLSYANEHRDYRLFENLFYQLLEKCQKQFVGKSKFRFKNKLYSLDATVIDLCLSMFDWAHFRQTKGAIKLHLILDHDGYLPCYAYISEGKSHEVRVAKEEILPQVIFPAGSIVVVDLGYTDYTLFAHWCATKVFFVTRMKDNADYEALETFEVTKSRNILKDERIRFCGFNSFKKCPYELRRIEVWDAEHERVIVLLTNNFKLASATVAAIYKDRWQIEIFFKALKQNLKIKTFVGTSANALKIQIWTALIAMLLLKYLNKLSTFGWSLSNLIAMLRFNLFTYRDLTDWLNNPFETPPLLPDDGQLVLPGLGLGQQQGAGL